MFRGVKNIARRTKYKFAKSVSTIPAPEVFDLGNPAFTIPSQYVLPSVKLGEFKQGTANLTPYLFRDGLDSGVSVKDLTYLVRSSVADLTSELKLPSENYQLRLLEATDSLEELFVDIEVKPIGKDYFVAIDKPDSFEATAFLSDLVQISKNLFDPIFLSAPRGKYYGDKQESMDSKPQQGNLFGGFDDFEEKSGLTKAYSSKTTGISTTVKFQSEWDLLYPILMPPLDFNFSDEFVYGQLYDFQKTGVQFLAERESALLADEMGTGKTVMSVVALRSLFKKGLIRKGLIICPVSILSVWDDHLKDWSPDLSVTIVRGNTEVRQMDWEYPAHVYVTNYDTVRNDVLPIIKKKRFCCPNPECECELHLAKKHYIGQQIPQFVCPDCGYRIEEEHLPIKKAMVSDNCIDGFDFVLIDEAQYIKNPTSGRSRAVRRLSPTYRWALSGTPIENRIDDVVSIFSFLKPGYLSLQTTYSPRQIREYLEPYFLRREKKDVFQDLPEKVKNQIWLDLDRRQRKEYDDVERTAISELTEMGDKVSRMHIFARLTKLKQICNFARDRNKSPKTDALSDLVEIIKSNDKKVLIFSQYNQEGVDKIETVLKDYGIVTFKGGMTDRQRETAIDKFKTDSDIAVFLANIKTGGLGLTLTEASYVIHFDHWWNPSWMWQAEDRAHRKGQEEIVNVYSFWMKDTVEDRIFSILKRKGLLFEEVVSGLSEQDIDNMISTEEWLEILGVKSKDEREKMATKVKLKQDTGEIFDYLQTVAPLHFEEIVRRLFVKLGYSNASLTKGSHDQGVDIIGSKHSIGGVERVIVQCKRTESTGANVARELFGVLSARSEIAKAFLVVSGKISEDCRRFCQTKANLVPIDGISLAGYIKRFNVELKWNQC